MSAISNSYSKSEVARSPRMIVPAPISRAYSTRRPSKAVTRTSGRSPSSASSISTRSSTVNRPDLLTLWATDTTSSGNTRRARWTRSR